MDEKFGKYGPFDKSHQCFFRWLDKKGMFISLSALTALIYIKKF